MWNMNSCLLIFQRKHSAVLANAQSENQREQATVKEFRQPLKKEKFSKDDPRQQ